MTPDTTIYLTPDEYQNLLQQAQQEPDFVFLGCLSAEGNPGRYQLFSARAENNVIINSQASPAESDSRTLTKRLDSIMAPFRAVTDQTDQEPHPFPGGWIGYVSYEFGYARERRLTPLTRPLPCPLLQAGLFLWIACFDQQSGKHTLYINPHCDPVTRISLDHWRQGTMTRKPGQAPWHMASGFKAEQSAIEFQRDVARVKVYIEAGDCYQANLSQAFYGSYSGDPWHAFTELSHAHPTPFSAYLSIQGQAILSLSPERFLSIKQGRLLTSPIKGTRPRGQTPEQDQTLLEELQSSAKDKAENLMIVDLLRNDLSRHCLPGTVRVPGLFEVESYRNVHHLVSHVEGQLEPGVSPFQAFLDAFPGGSITGAPKIRAMEIIRELEPHWRGPYCGSVFYWGFNDTLDSNIAIRTLFCDGESTVWCWGGGGIVADSDPQAEYEETLTKVRPLMSFLENL